MYCEEHTHRIYLSTIDKNAVKRYCSGFDGHVEDYYHYLSNETYEWITKALGECCPSGRVVSVLEGGYSLEARVSRAKAAQQV